MKNFLVVDDHPIVASALEGFLKGDFPEGRFFFSESADNWQNALAGHSPDVLIVDLFFGAEASGQKVIEECIRHFPQCKAMVLTMSPDTIYCQTAMSSGAKAYVLKTERPEAIRQAVEAIRRGETYLSECFRYSEPGVAPAKQSPLSAREREVARFIGEGKSSKEVANIMGLSYRTVESHRLNMMRKMSVSNTVQLLNRLIELGEIADPRKR